MKKLLIATRNPAKLSEYKKFFADQAIIIVSLADIGITEEIEEDGKDYFENSQKKALFYAKLSGLITLADDSGLEIDALGGEPGHKARRWLGYEATDKELVANMEKVSKEIPDDNRTARYRAIVTIASPNGEYFQEEGITEGIIAKSKAKQHKPGYPYDVFFYIPEVKLYYHEMLSPKDEKRYNHRYQAVQKLIPRIKMLYD